jgi:hypothetical protein
MHGRIRAGATAAWMSFTGDTPVRDYRNASSWRVGTKGEARWHAPDPEGEFTYLELDLDEITDNVSNASTTSKGR